MGFRTKRAAPRIERAVLQAKRPPDPRSAPSHLVLVRLLPCMVCGAPGPNDPHHLKRAFTPDEIDPLLKKTATRGTGIHTGDQWATPACRRCHERIETAKEGEEVFLAAHGLDGRAIARSLWAKRGDLQAMQRVIFANRQRAALNREIA